MESNVSENEMPSNNLSDYLDPEPGAEYQPCGQPAEVDNGYGHGAYPFCAGHRSSDKVEKGAARNLRRTRRSSVG